MGMDHEIVVVQAVEDIAQHRQQAAQTQTLAVAGNHAQPARQGPALGGQGVQRQRQGPARDHRLQAGDGFGVGPRRHQRAHQPLQALEPRVAIAAEGQRHAAQQQREEEVGAPVGQQGAARRTGHAHESAGGPARRPTAALQQVEQLGHQRTFGVLGRVGLFEHRTQHGRAGVDFIGRAHGQPKQVTDHAAARVREPVHAQAGRQAQRAELAQQVQRIAQRADGERAVLQSQHQALGIASQRLPVGRDRAGRTGLPESAETAGSARRCAVQQHQHFAQVVGQGQLGGGLPAAALKAQQNAVVGADGRVQVRVLIGAAEAIGQQLGLPIGVTAAAEPTV